MLDAAGRIRSALTTTAAAALLFVAGNACAETTITPEQGDNSPAGLAMAVDLVFGRPLGLVGSVLGIGLFVVGLPFEAISGDIGGPGKRLVVEPLQFTFTRPLGEFN